jgi:uncharacterized protein (UPF0548 family)
LDEATLRRLRSETPTYELTDLEPAAGAGSAGWSRLLERRSLGSGVEAFRAASDAVLSWRMHERAGFTIATSNPTAAVGTVVVLGTRFGPFRIEAPCRVVRVTDEPSRRGFAYVTLAGHPVSGEEEFLVELASSGAVTATVAAVSRPATFLARLGPPVLRWEQRRIADRYLEALATESRTQ